MNQGKFDFPIRYDASRKNDIRELVLHVSKNQGATWEPYQSVNPDRDTMFSVNAIDGVYWFQVVTVFKQGQRDPADLNHGPAPMKVLIDTHLPVVAIRSLDRVGDDATVVWDVQETNPDWSKFQIDYRVGDSSWQRADAQAGATGSTRFRVGQPGAVTVRVQATDLAGNRGEATRDAAPAINVIGSSSNPTIQTSLRVGVPADVPPPVTSGPSDTSMVLPPIVPPAEAMIAPARIPDKPVTPPVSNDPLKSDVGSPLAVSPGATFVRRRACRCRRRRSSTWPASTSVMTSTRRALPESARPRSG